MDVGMYEVVRIFTVVLSCITLMSTKESGAESGRGSGEGTSNECLPFYSNIDVDVIHKIAFDAAVKAVQYINRAPPPSPFRESSSSASPMRDVVTPMATHCEDEVVESQLVKMVSLLLQEVIKYRKAIDDLRAELDEMMQA